MDPIWVHPFSPSRHPSDTREDPPASSFHPQTARRTPASQGPRGNHKVGKHLATSLPPKMGKPPWVWKPWVWKKYVFWGKYMSRLVETKHGWDSRRHPKSFKKKQAEQKASILPGVCYLWGVHPVFSFDQDWNKWAHWVRMTAEDWTFLDGAQGLHESWLNW